MSNPTDRAQKALADALVYLEADAQAWGTGSDGHPHQAYLEECAKLRRKVAAELQSAVEALLADRAQWIDPERLELGKQPNG